MVPPNSEVPRSCHGYSYSMRACTVPAIWQYSSILCKSGIAIANSLQCPSTNWAPEGWFRTGTGVGMFLSSPPCRGGFWGPSSFSCHGCGSTSPGNEVTSNSDHSYPFAQGTQLDIAWPTHTEAMLGHCQSALYVVTVINVRMCLSQCRTSLTENSKQKVEFDVRVTVHP